MRNLLSSAAPARPTDSGLPASVGMTNAGTTKLPAELPPAKVMGLRRYPDRCFFRCTVPPLLSAIRHAYRRQLG
jgi:hypothetical protein